MNNTKYQIAQIESEIDALGDLFVEHNVKSFLEIGSKFGGSLWSLGRRLVKGSKIVAVDMPGGTRLWHESKRSLLQCIEELRSLGYDARVIWGNSCDAGTIRKVFSVTSHYDAVFIDANHTMPFVKSDWEVYGNAAGIVAFHDIAWKRAPDWQGVRIDVPEFWDRVKQDYQYKEFKFCPTGKNNGIGVLW